jgi:hypothetical protein
MAETVKEFLAKIGTRKLTDDEARQLHLLRLKEGHGGNTGFIEILANLKKPGSEAEGEGEKDKH